MTANEQPEPPVSAAPELSPAQLLAALGQDFMAYVLASDREDLTDPEARSALTEQQTQAFDQTLWLAGRFASWRRASASNDDAEPATERTFEPLSWVFGQFFQRPDDGLTLADRLRQLAGGTIRDLPDQEADPLRFALHWISRDIWPALLLPQDRRMAGMRFGLHGMAASAFNHPAQEVLKEAVGQTREPIRQLYPDLSGDLPDSVSIMSSAGSGSSVQLSLLAETLMQCAAYRCMGPLQADELFDHLDDVLEELRVLAKGRTAQVPATVGLKGLSLPDSQPVETALGTLHPAPPDSGPQPPGTGSPDLLYRASYPLSYTQFDPQDLPPGPPPGFFAATREFESRINLIRLAVLLACGSEDGQSLRIVSEHVHDPLHPHGQRSRWDVTPFSSPLQAGDIPEIQRWAQLIDNHAHPQIALAVRRTLSAADGTRDMEDSLVDAVIALEAMFGTGNTEVGFRLRTALAFLLATTEAERGVISDQVRALYKARSELVHGAGFGDPLETQELRNQAVELAVRCLRLLFSSHSDLIADQGRGQRIILAAGRIPNQQPAEPDGQEL